MSDIAVVGAGLSGLTLAKTLSLRGHRVSLFDPEPLGISNYRVYNSVPVHHVGGHCLSTKRRQVMEFIYDNVLREDEWIDLKRNAVVAVDKNIICPYPIELSLAHPSWPIEMVQQIKSELETNLRLQSHTPKTLYDYFKLSFGPTLTKAYFEPYNEKIWCEHPKNLDFKWVKDKTPQVSISEILSSLQQAWSGSFQDTDHSTFRYPIVKKDGRNKFLSNYLNLHPIIKKSVTSIRVNGNQKVLQTDAGDTHNFDKVVFTGSLKLIPKLLGIDVENSELLEINPVTVAVARGPKDDFSWKYVPQMSFCFHRIINMSYFSNRGHDDWNIFAIETTGKIDNDLFVRHIKAYSQDFRVLDILPARPGYVKFKPDHSPIVERIKQLAHDFGIHLCGRFATWSYDNADICIENALKLADELE